MRAIDTNVLVRLIVRDHPRQVRRSESYVSDGAWVSLLVLAETVWVLQSVYHLKSELIAKTIAMLLEHEQLVLQKSDLVRNALDLFDSTPSVGFTDCLVIAIAQHAGHSPLGTFDRKMSHLSDTDKL